MHKVVFKIEYTFPAGLFGKYHHLRTLEGKESFNNFSQPFNVKGIYTRTISSQRVTLHS